jgi:hypothetical protein
LRADAGYAGLVQHNPFHPRYKTLSGRDEPYSLCELAAHVELPRIAYRRPIEIPTEGRNIETFDRLRRWAYASIGEYRCGPRETWNEVVDARALAIAADVRAAHPYTDSEALDTAKSVAGWVWSRYVGGQLTRVRADAAVREIAHRLGASVRSVHRWISEIRCVPSPCAPSDFEPRREPSLRQVPLDLSEGSVDSVCGLVPCQRPGEGFPSAQPMGGTGCAARSAESANGVADSGTGFGGNQRC